MEKDEGRKLGGQKGHVYFRGLKRGRENGINRPKGGRPRGKRGFRHTQGARRGVAWVGHTGSSCSKREGNRT